MTIGSERITLAVAYALDWQRWFDFLSPGLQRAHFNNWESEQRDARAMLALIRARVPLRSANTD